MSSSEDQSASTKHKTGVKTNIDVFDGTRRRLNATTSIRNKNVSEMMNSRRKLDDSDDDENDNNKDNKNNNNTSSPMGRGSHRYHEQAPDRQTLMDGINQWVSQLNPQNNNVQQITQGVFHIRTLLMQEEPDPVPTIRQAGGVEALVALLDCPEQNIRFEALWSLTNLTDCSADVVDHVLTAGAVQKMIPMVFDHTSEKIRRQAAWCLGNICGNGEKFRHFLQDEKCLDAVFISLNGGGGDSGITPFKNERVETMRNLTFLLAQLQRFKPAPPISVGLASLPYLKRLIEEIDDMAIRIDVAWAVSFISEGFEERLRPVYESGIMPSILKLFETREKQAMLPCLRTFGNFAARDETTHLLFEWQVAPKLGYFLDISVPRALRKEALWTVSNAVCAPPEQVKILLDAHIMPLVVNCIAHPENEIRKEASWCVANIAQFAPLDVIRYLVETCGALDAVCHLLSVDDERAQQLAMEALEPILVKGHELRSSNNGINPYAAKAAEIGAEEKLGEIAQHIKAQLSGMAITILESFFGSANDGDDDNMNDGCGYFDDDENDNNDQNNSNDARRFFGNNNNNNDGYSRNNNNNNNGGGGINL